MAAPTGIAVGEGCKTLTALGRLELQDDEQRDLRGVLPVDVALRAASLNAAARQGGGERLVTRGVVERLGVEGVRRVVSLLDPRRAAAALARELMDSVRGVERER